MRHTATMLLSAVAGYTNVQVASKPRYPTRPWHGWYKLARWLKRREAQLSTEPLCCMCIQAEIVTAATVADHVVPHRGDADLFWYGELQSLCASHHSSDKQAEEHGKTVVRYGADGWPI